VVVLSSGSKAEVAPVAQGLSRGDHGSAVTAMQEALLKWNPTCLPKWGADGDFGGETEKALRAFQEAAGLPVTGVYDETTRKALADWKPQEEPIQPAPGTPAKYVQVREIHVRSAPGDEFMSLGLVQPGYRLPYAGETHNDANGVPWYLVEYDGQNGWLCENDAEVMDA
jgi:peptidoglycan hydrolase-like protein with peptidoglycan-binding domain